MANTRFYTNKGPYTLQDLAELVGASLENAKDPTQMISDVAPMEETEEGILTFLHNKSYAMRLKASKASVCILSKEAVKFAPEGMALLVVDSPYRAYAKIAAHFYPEESVEPGISSSAHIDPTASIGKGCEIASGVVIEKGAEIGEGSYIGPNTVIRSHVKIGERAYINANVTIEKSEIGNDVTIHTGARIGRAGFGFSMDKEGYVRVPQLGRVLIEDQVEIGANATIDRGSAQDTVIGRGTMIDNLVQIGHNVKIGRQCIIVAQVGIAGSTTIGDYTVLAGQVGIAGHLKIGSGVKIAAQSGVMRNIKDGEIMAGYPAVPVREWHRQTINLSKIASNSKKE